MLVGWTRSNPKRICESLPTNFPFPRIDQTLIEMPARKTLLKLIEQFRARHEDRYLYDGVVYVNSWTKIRIQCRTHGEFEQRPDNHLQGMGCPLCGFRTRAAAKTLTHDQCIERFRNTHETRYCYDEVVYVGQNDPVIIICSVHGRFEQRPAVHWLGMGCQACGFQATADAQRMPTEEFVQRATAVHGVKYDYSDTLYVRGHDKVVIRCPAHGPFEQDPFNHLNGFGCSMCTPVGFSKPAVEWLEFMGGYYGIQIQHAGNGGEMVVPGTRYRADGYSDGCVWEFDGDYFHGNPRIYASDKAFPHSKTGVTFGDHLVRTVRKRVMLRSLGFKVIHVWEDEWNRAKDRVIEIQRAFRSKRSK
jgi:G:T-mismatch repair DNA endonuclease (very short patch repair protein)